MVNFSQLQNEVIEPGNCVACGTCLGLFPEQLEEVEHPKGPRPALRPGASLVNPDLLTICPGYGINYGQLHQQIFGEEMRDFLLGHQLASWVGHATDPEIRRGGSSGGVLTAMLIYLLEEKLIDGAIVIEQGSPEPWSARPVIATTPEMIKACAQSVYIPVMTNRFLEEAEKFKGRLAYVGLPFQVAALRRLQALGNIGALKVDYVFGPYKGTSFLLGAIESYLRSNGIHGLEKVKELKYRDGEWPGYLRIELKDGRVLRSPKFYYNYLIPFFITKESLISIDFANELTDLSVGDAWSPKYENLGQGHSVILARTEKARDLAEKMATKGLLELAPVAHEELLRMHAHMIDFKKRGSFIRIAWMHHLGLKYPRYDYKPNMISISRYLVELVISFVILTFSSMPARKLAEKIPSQVLGWIFDWLRRSWKFFSKPVKRRGLSQESFKRNTF